MKILENILCFLIGVFIQTFLVVVFLILLIFDGMEKICKNDQPDQRWRH